MGLGGRAAAPTGLLCVLRVERRCRGQMGDEAVASYLSMADKKGKHCKRMKMSRSALLFCYF